MATYPIHAKKNPKILDRLGSIFRVSAQKLYHDYFPTTHHIQDRQDKMQQIFFYASQNTMRYIKELKQNSSYSYVCKLHKQINKRTMHQEHNFSVWFCMCRWYSIQWQNISVFRVHCMYFTWVIFSSN